jgi:hypothetical protein
VPDDLRRLPVLDVDAHTARRIERRLREDRASIRATALSAVLATTAVAYLSWAIAFTSTMGNLAR